MAHPLEFGFSYLRQEAGAEAGDIREVPSDFSERGVKKIKKTSRPSLASSLASTNRIRSWLIAKAWKL